MKKQNRKAVKTEKQHAKIKDKEEKKSLCKDCLHLDTRTIRDFARHGIRQGLIERRGKCMCEKVKSYRHLVRIDMTKNCTGFEEGQFVVPEKETKDEKKKEETVKVEETKEEKMPSPSQYHGPDLSDVEKAELKKNKKKLYDGA